MARLQLRARHDHRGDEAATGGKIPILGPLRETLVQSVNDSLPMHAAALAFYSLFSIAPLMLISVAMASLVLDEQSARQMILQEVSGMMGQAGADGVAVMLDKAQSEEIGPLAGFIGLIVLLLGATGVFGQLQDSLNTIWDAPPRKSSLLAGIVRGRFLSFAMVLAIGFLLVVSLMFSAAISAIGAYLSRLLPGGESLWQSLDFFVSLGLISILFALIFMVIPDRRIGWRDVWIGAIFSSLLFSAGKMLIGLYLGKSAIATMFGAAGSIVVVLVWIYYSALLVLLGAEFTYVQATMSGRIRGLNLQRPGSERPAG